MMLNSETDLASSLFLVHPADGGLTRAAPGETGKPVLDYFSFNAGADHLAQFPAAICLRFQLLLAVVTVHTVIDVEHHILGLVHMLGVEY